MTAVATMTPHARYSLALGDDSLILAQRLGEWSSRAPELEEDVALTNIALDLLGQARALLSHAGELEGAGRDEDDLAFLRDEREVLNVQLVELDNGDFAATIARQLLFSTYQLELFERLQRSADATIAGVAGKAVKEVAYHVDHAVQWTLRLGDGTELSHHRMQSALDATWPFSAELFERDWVDASLLDGGVAVDPASLRAPWDSRVTATVEAATLAVPQGTWHPGGGRRGIHTEGFGHMLATMQHLHRSHRGARW